MQCTVVTSKLATPRVDAPSLGGAAGCSDSSAKTGHCKASPFPRGGELGCANILLVVRVPRQHFHHRSQDAIARCNRHVGKTKEPNDLKPTACVFRAIHCNYGRCLSSLGLYLEDGVSWGHRYGIFISKDEDPFARQ